MQQLPEFLRAKRQWLIWKFHKVDGGKPRKIPYYVSGRRRRGRQGCEADISQLASFKEAIAACKQQNAAGIGFALTPDCGVVALDFDNCVDANGDINAKVEGLVSGTYAEFSPSKKGVRAFFQGDIGNAKDLTGEFGFEVFSNSGFVTVTQDVLPICALIGSDERVAPVSEEVVAYCDTRFKQRRSAQSDEPLLAMEPVVGLNEEQLKEILEVLDPAMPYPEWINIGMALHHETEAAGFHIWNEWSSEADNYPGSEALLHHWDSFGNNKSSPVTARLLLKLAKDAGVYIDPEMASASEFERIEETNGSAEARFAVVDAEDFADCNPTPWLIKGVLPKADLGVVFGESGSGKSFFVSDMALSLALGKSWRGHKSRQSRVVYLAAEGGSGFRKRLKAYEQHHKIDLAGVPFGVIPVAPNFLQKVDALDVAKAIKAWGGADLVIIDTFAQVTPGANENAGEDVGKALAHFRGLNRALGAMVLLVHHSGKDTSKGARGWSGLRAAADVELEVIRTESGRVTRVTKQKDGDDHGEFGFELEVVPLGMDEDGDIITSCAVVEAEVPSGLHGSAKSAKSGAGKWTSVVISVVSEFGLAQSAGIEVEAVIAECLSRTEAPAGKRDTRKQHIRRALKALCTGDDAPYFEEDGCLEIL
jgi:hypothetical protein